MVQSLLANDEFVAGPSLEDDIMSRMKRQSESHVISATSILILSGFLIGLTVGKVVAEDISPYVLSCGLAGFVAFIALDHIGVQREEKEDQEEQGQVQSRLDRHVMSLSASGFILPPAEKEETPAPNKHRSAADLRMLDSLYDELSKSGTNRLPVSAGSNSSIQA